MRLALVILLALSPPTWWRDTNSHAASRRARRAYEDQQYAEAARSYARAQSIAPSTRGAFNLGTAEIAAGEREQGSARLEEALRDPSLAADAFFNRGNSALAAKAFEHAVRDYISALKANPDHAAAKRNLEIALRRSQQQRSGAKGQQSQDQGQSRKQQPQPDGARQQQQQKGSVDLESLLRSVQQQEQEELRRMRGKAGEGKVGW